jgi:hypothetical protein
LLFQARSSPIATGILPSQIRLLNPPAPADKAPSAFDAHTAKGNHFDGFGIQVPFDLLNAGVQGCGGVVVMHGNGLLGDDGAGIDSLVDKMNGATGHFYTVIEGLFPGFQTGKGGQKRGVDVDDAVGKSAEEFAFEDAHEAGEHDEINLGILEHGDEALFGLFVEFGAEFAGRDVECFEFVSACQLENAGVFDVTGDDDDFHGGAGAGAVTREGIEVGTFAGAEHTEFNFPHQRHGVSLAWNGREEKAEKITLPSLGD